MSIRLAVSHVAAGAFAALLAVAVSGEAQAQATVMKECGSQYQAKKADNALNGQSWQDFLKDCRARITTPAADAPKEPEATKAAEPAKAAEPVKPVEAAKPAEPAKPTEAAKPAEAAAPAAATAKKPASEGQTAARERQKACGAEWKAKKADLKKTDPKITWPKYWSACNTRMKGEGK